MYRPVPRRSARPASVALAALLAGAVACAGPSDAPSPDPQRKPLALEGKPLVETARGAAIADELVVSVKPAAAGEADELARKVGAEILWRASFGEVYVFGFATAAAAEQAAARLARDARVDEVAENVIARGAGREADGGAPWNLAAIGLGEAGAPEAGAGVRVAILDSGAAYEDHRGDGQEYALAPSLDGVRFVAPYDFVDLDEHANDGLGHGTHVASLIAAQRGVAPVAGAVEIMPIRVLDDTGLGTELALAEGIAYAVEAGADVINMSLSFPPSYFPSRYLQRAIDLATEEGVVLVASTGNHGAGAIAYPAAFRDAIAVGASALATGQPPHDVPRLEAASYSNTGFLVDVLAPGGDIDRDEDRDGQPDAILAESFESDPTDIQPMWFAGSSQAAAHVSGVIASMLAANPDLGPLEVRAILGETAASSVGWFPGLNVRAGRGHTRADRAVAAARESEGERVRTYAGVHVTIETAGARKFGWAEVEILDQAGYPIPRARVYGSFTGGAFGPATAVTDRRGIAVFRSQALSGSGQIVGFQVEAVSDSSSGHVDRPAGFFRTDSCSLELLARYAEKIGATGVGTSPQGVGTSPQATPIVIEAPARSRRSERTVSLVNLSWTMSTVPMAVAVDKAWFLENFDDAGERVVRSEGAGVGTSPMSLSPDGLAVELDATAGAPDACIDLLVSTFAVGSQGVGTSPQGVGTSPQLVPVAPDPRGNCGTECESIRAMLVDLWLEDDDVIIDEHVTPAATASDAHDHLSEMVDAHESFGTDAASSPVGGYVNVLGVADLDLAPYSDEEGPGTGFAPVGD